MHHFSVLTCSFYSLFFFVFLSDSTIRYEKPLLMQICRLLRGFTHPGTYFDSSTEEIALFRYISSDLFALCMFSLLLYWPCTVSGVCMLNTLLG